MEESKMEGKQKWASVFSSSVHTTSVKFCHEVNIFLLVRWVGCVRLWKYYYSEKLLVRKSGERSSFCMLGNIRMRYFWYKLYHIWMLWIWSHISCIKYIFNVFMCERFINRVKWNKSLVQKWRISFCINTSILLFTDNIAPWVLGSWKQKYFMPKYPSTPTLWGHIPCNGKGIFSLLLAILHKWKQYMRMISRVSANLCSI